MSFKNSTGKITCKNETRNPANPRKNYSHRRNRRNSANNYTPSSKVRSRHQSYSSDESTKYELPSYDEISEERGIYDLTFNRLSESDISQTYSLTNSPLSVPSRSQYSMENPYSKVCSWCGNRMLGSDVCNRCERIGNGRTK